MTNQSLRLASVVVMEDGPVQGSVLKLQREDVWGTVPKTCCSQSETREAHDLAALLKITSALSSVAGLAGLDAPLLDLIIDAIPASRGALLFTGTAFGEFRCALARDARSTSGAPLHISREMLRSVLEDCVGILCQTESLSIAAAPLLAYKRPIGFPSILRRRMPPAP